MDEAESMDMGESLDEGTCQELAGSQIPDAQVGTAEKVTKNTCSGFQGSQTDLPETHLGLSPETCCKPLTSQAKVHKGKGTSKALTATAGVEAVGKGSTVKVAGKSSIVKVLGKGNKTKKGGGTNSIAKGAGKDFFAKDAGKASSKAFSRNGKESFARLAPMPSVAPSALSRDSGGVSKDLKLKARFPSAVPQEVARDSGGVSKDLKRKVRAEWTHGTTKAGKMSGVLEACKEETRLAAVDNEGRQYDFKHVVVNFINVGASFAKRVLGNKAENGDTLFDWEGVRRCVRHLTCELKVKVIGVVYENFHAPENGSPFHCTIPDDRS